MKHFSYLIISVSLLLITSGQSIAQSKFGPSYVRCATMERVNAYILNASQTKTGVNRRSGSVITGSPLNNYRLNAVVYVPIVVHIVLPNPYIITDADVQAQIDRLNFDFSGLNDDSTNAPAEFLALRGHSKIQFCLAKRKPNGQVTSGIERRVSSVTSVPLSRDPVKFSAEGGLDAWDPTAYLNLWIGADDNGGDVLGYAQFPGSSPIEEDGVFINYKSWGTNSCYTLPGYNKGRTATHEIGHYFGLLHIWGDDEGCDGDDFRSLAGLGSTCNLPAGLYNPDGQGNGPSDVGDTPNQAGSTTNCPSTAVSDACSVSPGPGRMFQNQMDYSLDACLTMFTKKQVERMEWVLENCRSGLVASLGCQPPTSSITRDAAPLHSVNPGGFELTGCTTRSYPSTIFCAGSFTPKVRIINNAHVPLTSVTVGYILDNGTAVTQTVSVNLVLAATTVITFPDIQIDAGAHEIKFFTSSPNGGTDQVTANDMLIQNFNVNGTTAAPFVENFAGPVFPPANWSIINPDAEITWEKYPNGNITPGSAYLNTFNYTENGEVDDLVSPRISFNTSGVDSVILSFDVAAATYSDPDDASITMDTLHVLISKDCGNTFTTVYKKWGKTLRTVTTPQTDEFFPTTGQWRKEQIDLSNFADQSPLQVFFRVTNNFENNIFIDNVNFRTTSVPEELKKRGYLILPNPFRETFALWHYEQPTDLRSITVYNSVGQLMWSRQYNNNADKYIPIDLFGKPAGVYFIRVEYFNISKTFADQVIKF